MTDPLDDGARDKAFQGADPASRPMGPAPVPAAQAAAAIAPRRGRGWGRFFKWWLLLSLAAMVICVVCLGVGMSHLQGAPMHIIIDGDDIGSTVSIDGASDGIKALLAMGGLFAALFVMLLVPMVLLLVVAVVCGALALGLGWAFIGVAIALLAVTFPIWIVALPIWFFARRRRALHSATIAA